MQSEIRDSAEAKAIRPGGFELSALALSNEEMAAFSRLVKSRRQSSDLEQEMFGAGFSFSQAAQANLYGTSAYTGERLSARFVMDNETEKKTDAQELKRPLNEILRSEQFTDAGKQNAWTKATEDNRSSQHVYATMESMSAEEVNEIKAKGGFQKFEITGLDVETDHHRKQLALRDDYLNRSENKPSVSEVITVESLLGMLSDIGPASKESGTLRNLLGEMRKHPWEVGVIFEPHPKHPEYDPKVNTIHVDSAFSKQKQVETFGHELYHATHQNLDELYGRKDPVSLNRYKQIKMDQEAGSFLAEFKVNRELKHTEPVTFDYVLGNNVHKQPIADLVVYSSPGVIDEAASKQAIAKFLSAHPAPMYKNGQVERDSTGQIQTNSYSQTHEHDHEKYKFFFSENRAELLKRGWLGQGY